ncbi:NTP/NDP exchange transporter [Zwartia vadi]|uniref:NTP/NDP exchange transporter n=1 Tax=Zwartia vadi TaxID=3058168 RepID=UPI0025B597CB|nr:MFS transporter [Zwartia vadi]MDN3986949.1 MFS transporter [Zwartia vadi]
MTSLLQTFTNIRRQEVLPTLVAGLFFFCILSALMVVRPAREALGMQRGIEAIRWLFLATLMVTLLVNPLFSLLVSRFRRLIFITTTYTFFALGLLCFYALLTLSPAHIGSVSGQVFYVWFSVFNLFATMLFWALMSDRFSKEQSQRLFAAISLGGTLGAMFGPWLASTLAKPFGTPLLLVIAAGFLMGAVASAWWLSYLKDEVANSAQVDSEEAIIGGSAWEGFTAVIRSPYLLGISAYVLILAIVATLLYFTRLQMVAALSLDTDTRTAAFARIDLYTQAATFVLQAFLTSHLIKRFGIALTLALLPITVALGFIGLALLGSLAALIAFEASFRAVQRGIMRPARETLFTTVPRAERYKAKAFIDTFVYRGGDALGSQTEGLLGRLGMGLAGLAWFAVPLAVIWMSLGLWLGYTQNKRNIPVTPPSHFKIS